MLIFLILICILLSVITMFIVTKINTLNKDIVRFILTGGLNTFNYYLIYLILYEIYQLDYLLAHTTAFLLSAFISFFITTYYTFSQKPTIKKFFMFPLTFLPNFVISTLFIVFFVRYDIMDETYASFLAMLIAVPVTFIISKKVIRGKI